MPTKSHCTKTRTANNFNRRFSVDEIPAGYSPGADSQLMSADSSHHNEEEGTLTLVEKKQMLAHMHSVLIKTVTKRPVPFPLHVAFAEAVPLEERGIAPPRGLGSTVGFWEWEGERYQWGIPLAQLAEGRSRLAYANEMAFDFRELLHRSVRFELVWPGYLHRRWMVSLPLYDDFGEEILWTKKGLGTFLAFQYREFAESCTRGHIICKEPTWRIGSGGIAFQDMRIVTFWNITKDIWRAEITVDVPSNGWAESRQDYYSLTGAEGCYNKIRPEGKDKRCPSCSTVHRCDRK